MSPTDIKTVQLSKHEPSSVGGNSPSGAAYVKGTFATIFQNDGGDFGYCYHGIGVGGNAFESEDVDGFDTAEEAERDARENYQED